MDDRIFPGLPEADEAIIKETMRFLNVKTIIGRKGEVAGCKRMIVFLMQEFYPDYTLQKYGDTVGIDHATVLHYRRNYAATYYKKGGFYNFVLTNLRAKVQGWKSVEMTEIYLEAIERFPINESKKARAKSVMHYKYVSYKGSNIVAKMFILYFLKQGMSSPEVGALLGIKTVNSFNSIKLPNKHLYLSIIESVVRDKTAFLQSQQTFKNNSENEKRKINNRKA